MALAGAICYTAKVCIHWLEGLQGPYTDKRQCILALPPLPFDLKLPRAEASLHIANNYGNNKTTSSLPPPSLWWGFQTGFTVPCLIWNKLSSNIIAEINILLTFGGTYNVNVNCCFSLVPILIFPAVRHLYFPAWEGFDSSVSCFFPCCTVTNLQPQ